MSGRLEADSGSPVVSLERSLEVMKTYAWIYNFPVVDLLVHRVLESLDSEWRTALGGLTMQDLNSLAEGLILDTWPDIIQKFARDCQEIGFHDTPPSSVIANSSPSNQKGVSNKKNMEVALFSALIDQKCKALGISHIVDLGCGLGHLDQCLSEKYGYKILGLESQGSIVKKAQESRKESKNITFMEVNVQIEEGGLEKVTEIVAEWLERTGGKRACLTGLHTCGNLASTTLRLFTTNVLFSVLILAPCCFHKLDREECSGAEEKFPYFPQSCELQRLDVLYEGRKFMRRPFLRLASQMSAKKWSAMSDSEHRQHSMHVLIRAALQLYAKNNGLNIKKLKRKALSKGALDKDVTSLLEALVSRYELLNIQGQVENFEKVLQETREITEKYWEDLHLIEGLTALQCCLQAPADRLLFSDIQQFLTEHDLHLNRVELLWDETLSPRSHAILATRNSTS